MSLQLGQVIDGKYRILRVIGEGGMGAVYEGENLRIRRRVAIKLLHGGVASNTEMVQRFEREAQVAGTVGNDHILEILDLGALPSGERYMVMEYLDGETLTERIKARGRLLPSEAIVLIRQVLRGLAAAHVAGIVHRDLKPDNIFILKEKAGQRDYVKIIDFGISKFAEQEGGVSSRMTRTGALMGTPHYMAPEQATGSTDIDRRTDVYAIGIILYEMVTGRLPFEAETFNQLLFEIALAKLIPARQVVPDLDPGIDSIIMKATARDPAHRFQSAQDFIAALDEWERSGSAVSVPPEQSLEAIVAATVPRASAGRGLNTPVGAPITASGGRVSAPPSTTPATAVSAAPVQPTVNTWANTPATVPRTAGSGLVLGATALGVVLLVGGGIAAYALTRPAHSPDPGASPSSATVAAEPPAAVTASAKTNATSEPTPLPVPAARARPAASTQAVAPAPDVSVAKPNGVPVPTHPTHRPREVGESAKPKGHHDLNFGY
jgi:serine/threonine-protein kinase